MPRFALLLTTFIWGATFPATKAVLEQTPPLCVSVSPISLGRIAGRGRVSALEVSLTPRAGGLAGKCDRYLLALSRLCPPNGRAPLYHRIEFRLHYGAVCRHRAVDPAPIRSACVVGHRNRHGGALAAGEAQRIRESWRSLDARLCDCVCRAYRLSGTVYARGRCAVLVCLANDGDGRPVASHSSG